MKKLTTSSIILFSFLYTEFCFSQSFVGQSIQEVGKQFTSYYEYKNPKSDLHRVVFYKSDTLESSVLIYAYCDIKGIIKIELPSTYVFVEEMYYQIDTTIEESYSDFVNGYAIFRELGSNKQGLIDISGNVVIQPQYTVLGYFSEGLAFFANLEPCVSDETRPNRMGYIDITNKHIIELPKELSELYACCYFYGEPFKNGKAIMSTREFGFDCNSSATIIIDKTGKILKSEGELLDVNYKPVKLN